MIQNKSQYQLSTVNLLYEHDECINSIEMFNGNIITCSDDWNI